MNQFEKQAVELARRLDTVEARLSAPALIAGLRDQEFWFENLVQNGDMTTDTIWSKGTGWSIGSGVASCSGAQTGNSSFKQAYNGEYIAHQPYFTQFTISNYVAGSVNPHICSVSSGNVSGNGLKQSVVYAGTSVIDGLNLYADSLFQADVDNASVYTSDGVNPIHRMPNGWKPHRVFVDGLLQREGAAHDYEIKLDPEGYYIVPAVAPGAATQTCIMGVRVK